LPVEIPLIYEHVYGTSPTASIRVVEPELGPWFITVKVTEFLTKKLIEGAKIVADTGEEAVTDATGSAPLILTGGARKLKISKSGYRTKTWSGLITADTTIGVSLIPLWMIGLGIVSIGSIGVFIGAKLLWRK